MEQKLDEKKRIIIIIIAVLTLTIGVTLAFIIAQIQDSAKGNASVTSDTTDNLRFEIDKEITLNPNQFTVTEGGSGLSDTAVGSAILRANSTDNNATYSYYVYFNIKSNNYVYTTTDQKPEIVLTITDPNGNLVTSIPSNALTYVEVTNADGSEVKGFDITTKTGLYNIASLYEITSTSSTDDTIHDWTFTVTFINLDTNQYENGGKTLEGEVILSKEIYKDPDITIAAYSNGVSINHAYNKNYTITSNCSNVVWNNKYQGVDISFNDSIPLNCNLEYTPNNTTNYLNNYIINLSGTTQGTGQVVNENGYRYEGKNPNNYIWFNNELWRIIGVFDEASHGVSGENLVKIIRANSIGGLVWDKNDVNDWSQSSLMNLLNGAYLNSENGTGGEYCYGYSTTTPANCDYTETGINDTYRPMIENVTWYLGGYSSASATTEAFYGYERGTTVYSGNPTSTEGYIGLMYPSDYGYSVLASSCVRTTNLSSYNKATCAGQSWLYGQGYEWPLTPDSSGFHLVFSLSNNGTLNTNNSAANGFAVRPVLYLDSSVYVIDGNGSISDPYIIGM